MIEYCKKHERYHGEGCIDCIRKVPSVKEQEKKLEAELKKQRLIMEKDLAKKKAILKKHDDEKNKKNPTIAELQEKMKKDRDAYELKLQEEKKKALELARKKK